jgi:hypothetical protein
MHNKSKTIPNCNDCKKNRVAVLPENYLVYSIIEKYSVLFADGMGGINVSSIKEIVTLYQLDDEEEINIIQLILSFCKTAKEIIGDSKDGN